jgi:hypothetical protein
MAAYHHVTPMGLRSILAARSICVVRVAASADVAASVMARNIQRRRIYVLESLAPTQPAAVRTIAAFRKRLSEKTSENFEIFVDCMDLERFPSEAHIDRIVRFLAGKYAEAPPDVLIPLGRAAVPFLLKHRDVIAPRYQSSSPACQPGQAAEAKGLANTVAVVTEYNFLENPELARLFSPRVAISFRRGSVRL